MCKKRCCFRERALHHHHHGNSVPVYPWESFATASRSEILCFVVGRLQQGDREGGREGGREASNCDTKSRFHLGTFLSLTHTPSFGRTGCRKIFFLPECRAYACVLSSRCEKCPLLTVRHPVPVRRHIFIKELRGVASLSSLVEKEEEEEEDTSPLNPSSSDTKAK